MKDEDYVRLMEIVGPLEIEGKLDIAIRHLSQAIRDYPNDLRLYLARGALYVDKNCPAEALVDFTRSNNESKDSDPYIYEFSSRAVFHTLVSLGRTDEAVAEAHSYLDQDRPGAEAYRRVLSNVEAIRNRGH